MATSRQVAGGRDAAYAAAVTIETDPQGFRIVPSCTCPTATDHLRVIRDTGKGAVSIEWHQGLDAVRGIQCCLRCAAPLRVEVTRPAE